MHTLIGKDKYLFLINDSNCEIECHQTNKILTDNTNLYYSFLSKFSMLVYPDKSYVCQQFLPDEYQPLIYRPGFFKFYSTFGNHIFDSLPYVNTTDYYKTDSHMNLNGVYKVFILFISYVNNLFNIDLQVPNIEILHKEVDNYPGDLKMSINCGNMDLSNYHDILYYNDQYNLYASDIVTIDNDYEYFSISDNQLVNKKMELVGQLVDWIFIGKYIIYRHNNNACNKKILIFYDSFSNCILKLLLLLSSDVYIFKGFFNLNMINIINPDIILELRIERFLN